MNEPIRKSRTGRVVKHAMQKTATVLVERAFRHPKYPKTIRRSARILAHDEKDEAKVGDLVRIEETRPLSARKHWRVVEVLEKSREV